MNLALLTSNHVRHKFFAKKLLEKHNLSLVVSEEKGNDKQKVGDTDQDNKVLLEHFNSLEIEQQSYFGRIDDFPTECSEVIHVERGGINTPDIAQKIKKHNIEGIAVFGPGILKEEIFSCCPGKVLNAHQGLSPYYRGSGTNFWPFYNNELEYVGVTIHFIDAGIDTGGLICHGRPNIEAGDTMHKIGCKTVEVSADLMSEVFSLMESGKKLYPINQWDKGQLYQRKDFTADAVRKVKTNISNGLIDEYASNKSLDSNIQILELR